VSIIGTGFKKLVFLLPLMTDNPITTAKPIKKKKKRRYILGGIVLVLLLIGFGATYWLTQQSQDIRQQASDNLYDCAGPGTCPDGYSCYPDGQCRSDSSENLADCAGPGTCPGGSSCYPDGKCRPDSSDTCTESGGTWVGNVCHMGGTATCSGPGEKGGDPCLANGGICEGTGIIRCHCGNDNWVGGKEEVGCAALCNEAEVPCQEDCGGNVDPEPTDPPGEDPSPVPSPTPGVSPSPTPIGPMCLSIVKDNADPQLGDNVTFTCGIVAEVDHYVFRVRTPDGVTSALEATGAVSAPLTIEQSGTHYAQCQICNGADESTCHQWEALP
jgi:hypothetical protein